MVHDRQARDVGQRGHRAQDDHREPGVAAHRAPLAVGQRAGLVEDAVGDAELADVVQQRRAAQETAGRGVEPERRGDAVGDLRHAGAVARGVGRLGVDDAREASATRSRRRRRRAATRSVGSTRLHVGRREAGPEARGRARARPTASTSAGSNQVPRRARAMSTRGGRPALLPEDLHRLRQARDAGQQRDLSPARSPGWPCPSQCSNELADRGGGLLVEADPARDVGAALAAHPLELARRRRRSWR